MWLTSYDPGGAWPVTEVTLNERASIGERDDWAWASLTPAIALAGRERARVLVGARHQGKRGVETAGTLAYARHVCITNEG
jgi:hypothetical protein